MVGGEGGREDGKKKVIWGTGSDADVTGLDMGCPRMQESSKHMCARLEVGVKNVAH